MSDTASVSVFSNAFNFEEFLKGGVDPRTGMYTFNLSLGSIHSVAMNGPSLDINLQFNPLNSRDTGLGAGWELPLSRYDLLNQTLSLSSGDSYKATVVEGGLKFSEPHVQNFNITRSDAGHYSLIHKSGLREELEHFEFSHYAVPTRMVAANGASLFLDYASYQGVPRLAEIRSAERSLLSISYDDSQVAFTRYPGTDCEARFLLNLSNDRVSSIQLPTGDEWQFTYEDIAGLICLTQIDSAMGASESVSYVANGHSFPPGASVASLPYVNSHTLFPGFDQPFIVTEYEYSDHNFLGFSAGLSWTEGVDSLGAAPDDYCYTSTEMLMNGADIHRRTVRTYNKYHLLLSQVTQCGQATHSLTTQYHLLPGKSVEEQPSQFRLPLLQTHCYKHEGSKKQREEVSRTEFDEFGNLLKQIDPSGITTVSEFYPAAGADGCPADPLGFVRFEKRRTVTPVPGMAAAPVTETRYRYRLMGGLEDTSVQHVVPVEEQFYERQKTGDTLCLQTDLEYFELPAEPYRHGLLKKQTRIRHKQSTQCEFTYSLEGTTRTVQTTLTGFDGAQTSESRTCSGLSGALLFGKNEDGVDTRFDYDVIGRPLTETFAPGTAFEAQRHSSYTRATAKSPATLLNTDVNGVQQQVTYDGIGRVVTIEEQDGEDSAKAVLRVVYSAEYDAVGQLAGETHTDWLAGAKLPIRQTFIFDDWGQVSTTLLQSGVKQHTLIDPVSRKESRWTEGAGKTVTTINGFEKPASVEVFDRSGKSLGRSTYEYDGLGRAVGQTDPEGNTTTYTYDVFGRLTRSVLPDLATVETEYATHSHLSLPIEVKVGAHSLGKQVFDGLSRMTETEVGGRQTTLTYEKGLKRPTAENRPGGTCVRYGYEPKLGGKVISRKASPTTGVELLATYSFDQRSGALTGCSEQGFASGFEYTRSGKLLTETSTQGSHVATARYTYSLAGRLLDYTDVLGNEHKTTYDSLGRPKSCEQNKVKADFSYNTLDQLITVHTEDSDGGSALTTRLAYDDFGREVSRTFDAVGVSRQILTSRYNLGGKLAQKTLKHGSVVIRDESFTYDARGRLKVYECEGAQRPRDVQGNDIIKQTFEFDALDNILTLETEFPGGKNLATYEYSTVDATQLVGIHNSHDDYPAAVTLEYDADGHLIKDEQARTLTYDALGRLTQVATAEGAVLRGYGYDALDKLVQLSAPGVADTQRYYRDGRVASDVCGDDATICLRQDGLLLGQVDSGQRAGVRLSATDQQQTVLGEVTGTGQTDIAYSPYGYRPMESGLTSLAGFNGEHLDPLTGLYLPGNGYRAYSPALMRFHSPDSLSPFGAGGLNPYAYCLGDPINRVDPTGHVSWQSIVGIGLSIIGVVASFATFGAATPLAMVGLALGTASAFAGIAGMVASELMPDSIAGEVLGGISMVLGLASLSAGGLAAAKAFTQWGSRLLTSPAARPSKFGYLPGALRGGMPKVKGAKGGKAKAQAPVPEKWTLIEDIGKNDFIPENLKAPQGRYDDFKRGIEETGMSPHQATKDFLSNYDEYSNYKGVDRVAGEVAALNQAAARAARGTGMKAVEIKAPRHIHARLSHEHRVFFLEYGSEMKVVIKQIGGHDPKW